MKIWVYVLVVLSVASGSLSEDATVKKEKGTSATLQCKLDKINTLCMWAGPTVTVVSTVPDSDPRFTISANLATGQCDLTINGITDGDDGNWRCSSPGTAKSVNVNLLLIVKPTTSLTYNTKSIVGTSPVKVPANEDVNITCKSEKGRPKAEKIEWKVNGKAAEAGMVDDTNMEPDKANTSYSILTLKFTEQSSYAVLPGDKDKKWKEVECVIYQRDLDDDKTTLNGIVGIEFETTRVNLIKKSPNIIVCEANGLPEPTPELQKKGSDSNWKTVQKFTGPGSKYTLASKESGTYRCIVTTKSNKLIPSDELIVKEGDVFDDETTTTKAPATTPSSGFTFRPESMISVAMTFLTFAVARLI